MDAPNAPVSKKNKHLTPFFSISFSGVVGEATQPSLSTPNFFSRSGVVLHTILNSVAITVLLSWIERPFTPLPENDRGVLSYRSARAVPACVACLSSWPPVGSRLWDRLL